MMLRPCLNQSSPLIGRKAKSTCSGRRRSIRPIEHLGVARVVECHAVRRDDPALEEVPRRVFVLHVDVRARQRAYGQPVELFFVVAAEGDQPLFGNPRAQECRRGGFRDHKTRGWRGLRDLAQGRRIHMVEVVMAAEDVVRVGDFTRLDRRQKPALVLVQAAVGQPFRGSPTGTGQSIEPVRLP